MNGDRIEGMLEVIVAVTGSPRTPAPEETRLCRPASSRPAWPTGSRPGATGYHQVAPITGSSVGWTTGSALAPMKSAPVQYAGWDDAAGVSWGLAAVAGMVQKTEAWGAGWMTPVTPI